MQWCAEGELCVAVTFLNTEVFSIIRASKAQRDRATTAHGAHASRTRKANQRATRHALI